MTSPGAFPIVLDAGAGMAARERARSAGWLDAAAFAIPSLFFVEFQAVGRIFLSELLLVLLLPWLILHQPLDRLPRWALALGSLWLLGQVAADAVHASPFADYARGWSKIVLTLLNLTAICLLIAGRPGRFVLFGAGIAAGFALQFLLNPSPVALGQPWKFGWAMPVTIAAVLAVSAGPLSRRRFIPALVLLALAALNLQFAFRSLAGICFLASAYLVLQQLAPPRERGRSALPVRRLVFAGGLALVLGALFLQVYSLSARSGALGLQAQRTYEAQSGGAWGLILGGRSEALVSTQAIIDSPIIGHGSWAKDFTYTDLLADRLDELGYDVPVTYLEQEPGLIPTHSYILGAWVEGGILGGLFWFAVLSLLVLVLANLYGRRLPLSPLIAFAAVLLAWDICFSPYGAVARITAPYYIALLLFAWRAMGSPPDPAETPEAAPAGPRW